MVNPKKLIQMAKKWQRAAALGRRASSDAQASSDACRTSVADKGNFVVYSSDKKRFMVPLAYLTSSVFVQLFKMSEDEFGLPSDGPITLPCDSLLMEFILSFIRTRGSKTADRLLLEDVFKHHDSPCSSHLVGFTQQAVCSF